MTEFFTPHLRTVLKTYQNSATKSLQGPGHSLSVAVVGGDSSLGGIVKKELLSSPEPLDPNESPTLIVQPPPPPEISQPILSAPDSGRGELFETVLEGKTIGCFYLGGEMRLCLPQFLNNVLTDFTLDQINRIFDELRIFCSQCTPEQLMFFKAAKILPDDVKASGLITRTDAERLCSALLRRGCDQKCALDEIPKGAVSFKVYHRCFGKCEGVCTPDLYSYLNQACIRCLECKDIFSPQKFVGHVHRQQENRTCHWGFDSRNWHDYLHVALDEENRDKYTQMLSDLHDMEKHDYPNAQRDISYLKRKAEQVVPPSTHCKREPVDIPPKKAKMHDEAYMLDMQRYQQALFFAQIAQEQQMSAFRPWAPKPLMQMPYSAVPAAALPYLSQEPPVLQNPERVVRHNESERFERTYQPNVALAPRKSILSKEREKERERERERERAVIEPEIVIKQERPNSTDVDVQTHEEDECRKSANTPITASNNSNSQQRRLSMHSNYSRQEELSPNQSPPQQAISPSSNEITSSTSPIPNGAFNRASSASLSPAESSTTPEKPQPPPSDKSSPKPIDSMQSNRIRISKHLLSNTNVVHSPTPPPSLPPPRPTDQLQSPSQSSAPMSSNATQSSAAAPPHPITSNNNHPSQYEPLSNDEEEDDADEDSRSLNGEADSSNILSPWDVTADALKDVSPTVRDKVLHVIQRLIQDLAQYRHCRIENLKLIQEVQQRNEQIAALRQDMQAMQSQMRLCLLESSSVIAKVDSSESNTSTTTTTTPSYQEKIKVPLKKSARRSPEEAALAAADGVKAATCSSSNSSSPVCPGVGVAVSIKTEQ